MPSETERRLHPVSLLFTFLATARRLLIPAVVALFVSRGHTDIVAGIVLAPMAAIAIVRYWFYRYRFGADELIVRQGLLTRSERHIPYTRIQNINLTQNPLHRWLGVAEVQIETAGGKEPEAVMRVLSLPAVDALRTRVVEGRGVAGSVVDGAAGGHDAEARVDEGRDVLLRLPPGEVALFGLISNRGLVIVAAAVGLLSQIDVFPDQTAIERISQTVAGRLEAGALPDAVGAAALAALVLAAALVLLRLLSLVWATLRFHGFTLTLRGEDLRTERGLLTRITATVPRHRIQLVSLRSGWLHRLTGRTSVRVETAGGLGSDREGAAERLWLAPLVRADEAADLVERLLPGVRIDALDWRPPAARAGRRLARRNLAIAGLAGVALALVTRSGWALVGAVPLAAAGLLQARLYVAWSRWALTRDAIAYRSGWWVRRLSAVRLAKIQAVERVSTPFDRRHRMARLRVDTAGAGRIGHRVAPAYLDAATAETVHLVLEREAGARAFRW